MRHCKPYETNSCSVTDCALLCLLCVCSEYVPVSGIQGYNGGVQYQLLSVFEHAPARLLAYTHCLDWLLSRNWTHTYPHMQHTLEYGDQSAYTLFNTSAAPHTCRALMGVLDCRYNYQLQMATWFDALAPLSPSTIQAAFRCSSVHSDADIVIAHANGGMHFVLDGGHDEWPRRLWRWFHEYQQHAYNINTIKANNTEFIA